MAAPGVGMGIEAAATLGTDASPLAQQQGVAEQVGSDLHAVVAELVALGANSNERGSFRKERQLDGVGRSRSGLRRLGMTSREMYQKRPIRRGEKREPGSFWRRGATELTIVYQLRLRPTPRRAGVPAPPACGSRRTSCG
jgi:hypothetical protein